MRMSGSQVAISVVCGVLVAGASLCAQAEAQQTGKPAAAAPARERIKAPKPGSAEVAPPLDQKELDKIVKRLNGEHPGVLAPPPPPPPPGAASITTVALEGGQIACKSPITLLVTIHGGSAAKTMILRSIQGAMVRATPPVAEKWDQQVSNISVPANTDKTFEIETPWLWYCANDPIPHIYEVRLEKQGGGIVSTYAIYWTSIVFGNGKKF